MRASAVAVTIALTGAVLVAPVVMPASASATAKAALPRPAKLGLGTAWKRSKYGSCVLAKSCVVSHWEGLPRDHDYRYQLLEVAAFKKKPQAARIFATLQRNSVLLGADPINVRPGTFHLKKMKTRGVITLVAVMRTVPGGAKGGYRTDIYARRGNRIVSFQLVRFDGVAPRPVVMAGVLKRVRNLALPTSGKVPINR